jgi:hypothetical protein
VPSVRTGAEVLARGGFKSLQGLNVGLITNPTGVLPDLTSTIETLHRAPGVKLRALFGPEHGVRGDVPAGEKVSSSRDGLTGLPTHSLYGATKVPTAAMLRGLDVLVFDIQDIGARSYTYLSTLGCVMEGASCISPRYRAGPPEPARAEPDRGRPDKTGIFLLYLKVCGAVPARNDARGAGPHDQPAGLAPRRAHL